MFKPALWAKFTELTKQDAQFTINNYLKYMKWKPGEQERVLEIGCGPGNISKETLVPSLPKNIQQVTCIDISEDMIRFASENSAHERIKYKAVDVYDMEDKLGKHSFDHAFSFHTFHWIANRRNGYLKLYNVLKPGADALISEVSDFTPIDVFKRNAQKTKYKKYVKELEDFKRFDAAKVTKEVLQRIYKDVGFTIDVCEYKTRTYTFPNDSYIKGFLSSFNSSMDSMPSALREEYKQEYVDELKKEVGGYLIPYTILVSCIRKPESI